MLKRSQILLTDWLVEHLKGISEKYDISMSEAIRLVLSLQIPKLVSIVYPKYKIAITDKKFVAAIRKASSGKMGEENFHKLISEIYFEGRKATEFWSAEQKVKKQGE